MRKIQVKLFGPTTVITADGTALSDLGGIKPRQVLEILALAVGTPVSKDRLVEQLWGDNPPRTYTGTLESYISLLRRKMGIARGRGSALATTSNGYLLDATQVEVDLDQFRRLTRPAPSTRPGDALAGTQQALGLITGELLASEPYAEWAGDERAQFATEYLTACNRAADHALHAGDPHTAITLARAAIETDQISETAWQAADPRAVRHRRPQRGPARLPRPARHPDRGPRHRTQPHLPRALPRPARRGPRPDHTGHQHQRGQDPARPAPRRPRRPAPPRPLGQRPQTHRTRRTTRRRRLTETTCLTEAARRAPTSYTGECR